MPTKKYPLKIRLLKDMYPCIKGSEFTIEMTNYLEVMNRDVIYRSKLGTEISLKESENTNWFEPVIQEKTPPEMLSIPVESTLKFLKDGINQLKGSEMWHLVKERMNKMINDDKKI